MEKRVAIALCWAIIRAAPQGQKQSDERGRSSGVEHNLAKVRVESSNLFARSIRQVSKCIAFMMMRA
jgi:hypothetical protein